MQLLSSFELLVQPIIPSNLAFSWEHLTCAMSINAYSSQKLENLEPDHKEK
ncbi:MAG: hypothetical protein GPJ00_04045 [Microcystis aeruginosa W13-18]|nr:hypothetical protein [Microcystis aeruginosa W13-18]NCR35411.1 hypothetical protein [Microcystis aeruginosa S11-05]NCR48918.1 hypothetical protein [Microcystis aeruginosa S11-01]